MGSHTVNKLSVLFIKKAASPGKYGDGNGLFLSLSLLVRSVGSRESRLKAGAETSG